MDQINNHKIDPTELNSYLEYWGFTLTPMQARRIFAHLDTDKDGYISYHDFVKSCGGEIHPGEFLYFRQDQKNQSRFDTCDHEQCWLPIRGKDKYCPSHMKMQNAQIQNFYSELYAKLGKSFVKALQRVSDESLVNIKQFERVLITLGQRLSS